MRKDFCIILTGFSVRGKRVLGYNTSLWQRVQGQGLGSSLWQRILDFLYLSETQPRKWRPLHSLSSTPTTRVSSSLRPRMSERATAPSNMQAIPSSMMASLITCRGSEHAGSLWPGGLRFQRFPPRQLRTEGCALVDGIHKP